MSAHQVPETMITLVPQASCGHQREDEEKVNTCNLTSDADTSRGRHPCEGNTKQFKILTLDSTVLVTFK